MLNKVNRVGISMIVLIITIVIMIIIASTVILSIKDKNMVNVADETVIKADFQAMRDSYDVVYNDLLYDYGGDESLIKDSDFNNKKIISIKYEDRMEVNMNGLVYTGSNEKEIAIAKQMGITVKDK